MFGTSRLLEIHLPSFRLLVSGYTLTYLMPLNNPQPSPLFTHIVQENMFLGCLYIFNICPDVERARAL